MTASSVTGTGLGDAGKPTTNQLSILSNGPSIIFSGVVETVEGIASPPDIAANTVVFPYTLPGGAEKYVILLTTLNGGSAYLSSINEDEDGTVHGFSVQSEAEGTVMYMVTKAGTRPRV